jgi:hypothetical protein
MKNKKITYYILLPAVIVIWSLIVYKIKVRDNEYKKINEFSNTSKKERSISEDKEYQLLNNYKDPFFQHFSQTNKTFSSEEKKIVKPKNEKKWPAIRFDGYILNGDKIKCHLTVGGEDKILQEHEKILEDYIVLAITRDSVKIGSQGDSRWFKK